MIPLPSSRQYWIPWGSALRDPGGPSTKAFNIYRMSYNNTKFTNEIHDKTRQDKTRQDKTRQDKTVYLKQKANAHVVENT